MAEILSSRRLFLGLEEYFSRIEGVEETISGLRQWASGVHQSPAHSLRPTTHGAVGFIMKKTSACEKFAYYFRVTPYLSTNRVMI